MGNGARLAIAILVLFLAMVAFFFAFHPGGVDHGRINGPVDILKWMFGQYDQTVSGASPSGTAPADTGNTGVTPDLVGPNVAPIANLPGTNIGPNLVGPNVAPIANLPLWLKICKSKVSLSRHIWTVPPLEVITLFHPRPNALSNREQRLRHRVEMQRAIAEVTGRPVHTIRLPSVAMLRAALEAAAEMSEHLKPNSSGQSFS